jgi:hypothetical protein
MSDREIPERREVKRVLRGLGMTSRQVDALIRNGWSALVGETQAENEELKEACAALTARLKN